MDEYLGARWVSEPFRLYDCCFGDRLRGGGRGELGRACARPSAHAGGDRCRREGHPYPADDIANRPTFFRSSPTPRLRIAAPVCHDDMDFSAYDCFTYVVLCSSKRWLVRRGEGARSWRRVLRLTARLPTNTHGLLSQGHIWGMKHVVEAVRNCAATRARPRCAAPRSAAITGWATSATGSIVSYRPGSMSTV